MWLASIYFQIPAFILNKLLFSYRHIQIFFFFLKTFVLTVKIKMQGQFMLFLLKVYNATNSHVVRIWIFPYSKWTQKCTLSLYLLFAVSLLATGWLLYQSILLCQLFVYKLNLLVYNINFKLLQCWQLIKYLLTSLFYVTPFSGLTLGLLSKFKFSRSKPLAVYS